MTQPPSNPQALHLEPNSTSNRPSLDARDQRSPNLPREGGDQEPKERRTFSGVANKHGLLGLAQINRRAEKGAQLAQPEKKQQLRRSKSDQRASSARNMQFGRGMGYRVGSATPIETQVARPPWDLHKQEPFPFPTDEQE